MQYTSYKYKLNKTEIWLNNVSYVGSEIPYIQYDQYKELGRPMIDKIS